MPAAGKWRGRAKEKQGEGEGQRWKTSWLFPPNCTISMICRPVERGWVDRQQCIHSTAGLAAGLENDGVKAKLWSW